ncbi:hypothetical protein ACFWVP_21455 [Streptomyces sp. NPDC058637]|uniref:hypothetical protein n=1 Tax=Streptomyces sp. NPDC058637 TaxID=3346569 RepID=UPI003657A996
MLSTTGDSVMFDAACSGTEVGTLTESTVPELLPGRYRVASKSIEPDRLTSFRTHRFVELTRLHPVRVETPTPLEDP